MTAEEKNAAARFLDLTADYLLDGYRRPRAPLSFQDDAPIPAPADPRTPLTEKAPETAPPAEGQWRTEMAQVEKGAAIPAAVETTAPGGNASEIDSLEKIAEEVRRCDACRLCERRTQGVPGEGVSNPLVMVIGEAPGADEDANGRPFVGKAGQLLDRMLASIGLSRRENCFIANVVKCRPPQNRDPHPDEIVFCGRFLKRQIALLKPKAILCAGRISAQTMLRTTIGIGKLRGRFESYRPDDVFGGFEDPGDSAVTIPLLATYHPSALLRDEGYKRPTWEDLKMLRTKLIDLDSNYALNSNHSREASEQQ